MFPRSLSRIDRWILALFILVPIAAFAVPALLGHPALAGDNLIQNYPLRVLSGRQIASGHLPLWNPLAFSGFPLLGSMNAGSAFPATFLFAVLPDQVAWILNLSTAYSAAASGMFFLALYLGLRRSAAVFAAVGFAFSGAMLGHMVHLGLIQGQALLPWAVLAMLVIEQRFRGRPSTAKFIPDLVNAGWPLLVLAGCVGLAALTGEPRALADLFVVVVVVGAWIVLRRGIGGLAARLRMLVALGLAGGLGAALSAVQILPGRAVVSYSQRSNLSAWFIGSGSLKPTWTALLAIPTILGGNGMLHQPRWFIEYNLAEVTGYVGLISLVAFFAAVGQLFGRERRRRLPPWVVLFVVMLVVSLILSWGAYTWAFHGILQIPIINRTRLQSRNLAIVDLALCILLAWFVDRLAARDLEGASLQGWRRWLTLSPLFVTLVLVVAGLAIPDRLASGLSAHSDVVGMERFLWPWFLAAGLLAVGLGMVLFFWKRLGPARAFRLLVAVCSLDLFVFVIGCTTGLVAGGTNQLPTRASAASIIGTQGRFALVDPTLANLDQFVDLGKPNTNVFTGIPSVQGYGSLIPTFYGTVTDAHTQDGLSSCALSTGRLRQLRLSAVAAGTNVLAPMTTDSKNPDLVLTPPSATPCPGAPEVATNDSRSFYFGQLLEVATLDLTSRTGHPSGTAPQVSLIDGTGHRLSAAPVVTESSTGWTYNFTGVPHAGGVRVTTGGLVVSQAGSVIDRAGNIFSLDGDYQRAMGGKSWRLESTTSTYQVFRTTRPLVPKINLVHAARGSRVEWVHTSPRGADATELHLASAATIVRSVSYVPGWVATYSPVGGGAAVSVAVVQHDLVQSVNLPAGRWIVNFSYHPKGVRTGLVISGGAIAAFVAASVLLWLHGRRRVRAQEASTVVDEVQR